MFAELRSQGSEASILPLPPMPEVAINEHSESLSGKDDIGTAGKISAVDAISQTFAPEGRA